MKNITNLYNRWLRGELSSEQHHDLERSSLDDEMLYDAMEGIELYQRSPRSSIEGQLSDRLQQYRSKRRSPVITLWPYAAAASLALIVGIYGVLRLQNDTAVSPDTIALDIEEESTAPQMAYDISVDDAEAPLSEPMESTSPTKKNTESSQAITAPSSKPSTADVSANNNSSENMAMVEEMSSDKTNDEAVAYNTAPVKVDIQETIAEDVQPELAVAEDIKSVQLSKKKSPTTMSLQADESKQQNGMMSLRRSASADMTHIMPLIGKEKMIEILEANPFANDYLFMRGIKLGRTETISFSIDADGMPTDIDYGKVPQEHLDTLIKLIGPWPASSERVSFALPIFTK